MHIPAFLKTVARGTPLLKTLVSERDRLRIDLGLALQQRDAQINQVTSVQSELEVSHAMYSRLSSEVDILRQERQTDHAQRQGLQHQVDSLMVERQCLKEELGGLKTERDNLKTERNNLEARCNNLETERNNLEVKLGNTYMERDRLQAEVAVVVMDRERLRTMLRSRKKEDNFGFCHCCRQETLFEVRGEWLRDYYVCSNCFSIPRQRHLQYILDRYFEGWENGKIHESSPSNNLLSQFCDNYSMSQYFPEVESGSLVNGVRCENLESLTFSDNSFDYFITQDVFEHVFHPDIAAREIMRVLKPGGAHIFSAPRHKGLSCSYPRATLQGATINYLKPAVYHGSPVGDGKTLVTWDYGKDFEHLLQSWTGESVETYMTKDRGLGVDGEFLEVFVIRKRGDSTGKTSPLADETEN